MAYPASPYIDERQFGLYIPRSRVSLDSVVIAFQQGTSPEQIVEECFPTLKLWEVYGAIAYYLEHEDLIQEYLAERQRRVEEIRASIPPLSETNPGLWARLEAAKRAMRSKQT